MKGHVQDTQVVGGHVASEHLDGDDEGVLEQITVGGGGE